MKTTSGMKICITWDFLEEQNLQNKKKKTYKGDVWDGLQIMVQVVQQWLPTNNLIVLKITTKNSYHILGNSTLWSINEIKNDDNKMS